MRKWYLAISPRPALQLAWRQRGQSVQVAQHAARLPERAHQVLALRQVHAGLAADGRVHHAEQRRRDVHDRHPPVVGRGGEPGDVGHHAAADGHHAVPPGQARGRELAAQLLDRGQRLVALAVADLAPYDRTIDGDQVRDAGLRDDGDPLGTGGQHRVQLAAAPAPTHTSYERSARATGTRIMRSPWPPARRAPRPRSPRHCDHPPPRWRRRPRGTAAHAPRPAGAGFPVDRHPEGAGGPDDRLVR